MAADSCHATGEWGGLEESQAAVWGVIVVIRGWQSASRSGHWQQWWFRLQHPGASAIRIHNVGLVNWKGSRSCSSKPFEIIRYIASSSPPLSLPPPDAVTRNWTHGPNASPTPFFFKSCPWPHSTCPPILLLLQTNTPPPSPYQSSLVQSVSGGR